MADQVLPSPTLHPSLDVEAGPFQHLFTVKLERGWLQNKTLLPR